MPYTQPHTAVCRDRFDPGRAAGAPQAEPLTTGADWVRQGPRQSSRGSLLAAAVSSDGRYLAVGGGDKKVYVWDARIRQLVKVRCCGISIVRPTISSASLVQWVLAVGNKEEVS